jgi:hypothetical protein
LKRLNQICEVGQGFAHPHEHQTVDFPPKRFFGPKHLFDHFRRRQVPFQRNPPRRAKHASPRASDLGGQTQGRPIPFPALGRKIDRRETFAVGCFKKEPSRTVFSRHFPAAQNQGPEAKSPLPFLPQRLGQIAHVGECFNAPIKHPGVNLTNPVSLFGFQFERLEPVIKRNIQQGPRWNSGFGHKSLAPVTPAKAGVQGLDRLLVTILRTRSRLSPG